MTISRYLVKISIITVLLGLSLTACTTLSAHNHDTMPSPDESSLNDASAAPGGGTFLNAPLDQTVLNLELVDASGTTFNLAQLKGSYVVIANFLTSCQEVCPLTTASMRLIADKIDAAGLSDTIKVLEISVDPARDTPARLAAYQSVFGASNWTLASGSEQNITQLWDFFGVPPERMNYTQEEMATLPKDWQTGEVSTYDVMHADIVLIIDPDSNWRWLDLGHPSGQDRKSTRLNSSHVALSRMPSSA